MDTKNKKEKIRNEYHPLLLDLKLSKRLLFIEDKDSGIAKQRANERLKN